MSDLLFLTTVFAPLAAMLLAAWIRRRGTSRSVATAIVLLSAAAGAISLSMGVSNTYASFGESEGNGALATAYVISAVWLLAAAFSLFSISRAGAATQLGSESEK